MPLLFCIVIGWLSTPLLSVQPLMALSGGLYLFLSGLELDLRKLTSEPKLLGKLWLGAFFLPFVAGLLLVFLAPTLFLLPPGMKISNTALILAVAFAVSAVPVILKVMQELRWTGTLRAQRVVMTAVLCDLSAWIIFFPLLPTQDRSHWFSAHLPLLMLFVGIGVGSFLNPFLRFRSALVFFNKWIVATIFFIGVGQNLDFSQNLNLLQIEIVFLVATIAKTVGAILAARWAGLDKKESFSTGVALNARGAMEVILASFAFREGLIARDLFTSLVIMAIGTSLLIKPVLKLARFT